MSVIPSKPSPTKPSAAKPLAAKSQPAKPMPGERLLPSEGIPVADAKAELPPVIRRTEVVAVALVGLLVPRDQMARPLELISYVLPMTYAYDALSRVAASSTVSAEVWRDAVILICATALSLALGAATLRRRTA